MPRPAPDTVVMDLQAKLAARGLMLPVAPRPVAAYVPFVRTQNLVFISGQLPMLEGRLITRGVVPVTVDVEHAKAAAQQCLLNALAVLNNALEGDWSRFVRIVRLAVFVASANDFVDQPQVANGASELLVDLFGDAGRHARAAVGVNTLPLGAPVEVELVAETR